MCTSFMAAKRANMAQSVKVTLCTCLHVLHIEDVTMLAIHPLQLSMGTNVNESTQTIKNEPAYT